MLRNALPDKTEFVILVRMSPIQRKLYNAFMQLIKEGGLASWANSNNPIKAFSVFCKVRRFFIDSFFACNVCMFFSCLSSQSWQVDLVLNVAVLVDFNELNLRKL